MSGMTHAPTSPTLPDDHALLELAASAARAAAAAILAIRQRGFAVTAKADESPVTEADHAAEAIILAALRAAVPQIPIIAEEDVAAGNVVVAGACFWLIDPLDGTREFARGMDEFAVNVGLVRDGRVALGAVAAPASGELFGGIVGHGAWKEAPGEARRPIRVRAQPAEGAVVLASRHYGREAVLDDWLVGKHVQRVEHMGSALKFLRLAEGSADLYPRFGRTMEWDTAAPQAVLEAAGGVVTDFAGAPLLYAKSGWENPPFLCHGG